MSRLMLESRPAAADDDIIIFECRVACINIITTSYNPIEFFFFPSVSLDSSRAKNF